MDEESRCQSCGRPLDVGFYGTNADDTANEEFCKFCFEKGEFREPSLSLNEMVGRSVARMIDEENMKQKEAENTATELIPRLKRWNLK